MNLFSFLKRKNNPLPLSPRERINILKHEFDEKVCSTNRTFEDAVAELTDFFMKKEKEKEASEKHVPFYQVLLDADREIYPLVFQSFPISSYEKKIIFSRGQFTQNPFLIELLEFTNCVFLHVYEQEHLFITLYFDKIHNNFSEYHWDYACDFIRKQYIKQFLCHLINRTVKDRLYEHHALISWLQEKELFLKQMDETESSLKDEFKARMFRLSNEKETTLSLLQEQLLSEIHLQEEPTEKEVKESDFFVHDQDTAGQIRLLFHRVESFCNLRHLLDTESVHEITTLYEKDIHELWSSFMQLSKAKQLREKERFLLLLGSIHQRLDLIEQKINGSHEFDYEKKIRYLEKKFRS